MFANSRQITSNQVAPNPRLAEIVARHLRDPFQHRPSTMGRSAFAAVEEQLGAAPFVLDAGCGTGASTFNLARVWPRHVVIGVDRSSARLAIGQRVIACGGAPGNAILLHCGLVDFWLLATEAGLRAECQFLCYPNPWPKPGQFKRRWHGHPCLPAIIALGGEIELRTNWRVYAEEFAAALRLAGAQVEYGRFVADPPLTPFERKYAASGHPLWLVVAQRRSATVTCSDRRAMLV